MSPSIITKYLFRYLFCIMKISINIYTYKKTLKPIYLKNTSTMLIIQRNKKTTLKYIYFALL